MRAVFGSETRDEREDFYCLPSYIVSVLISKDVVCSNDLLINVLALQVEKPETV